MSKKHQKQSILFVIIAASILLLSQTSSAQPTIKKIVITPDEREIVVGSVPIALKVQATGANLEYSWKLSGPGKFKGRATSPAVIYIPPDKIDGKSAEATITVIVSNDKGQKATEQVTFKIKRKGMSTLTKTAIGAGAATAFGGIIYYLTKDDDDNDGGPFSGTFIRQGSVYPYQDRERTYQYTWILKLSQKGDRVTGTYQKICEIFNCCTLETKLQVIGSVQGYTASLTWGPGEDTCVCSDNESEDYYMSEDGGTYTATAINDGAIIEVEDWWPEFIRQ
ncbi:MAG: hypothetical protein GY797_18725 [Deltaproteobacteria bacterium]|nr:hypothetical protein [Deltaproteobacteria bacterium]